MSPKNRPQPPFVSSLESLVYQRGGFPKMETRIFEPLETKSPKMAGFVSARSSVGRPCNVPEARSGVRWCRQPVPVVIPDHLDDATELKTRFFRHAGSTADSGSVDS